MTSDQLISILSIHTKRRPIQYKSKIHDELVYNGYVQIEKHLAYGTMINLTEKGRKYAEKICK